MIGTKEALRLQGIIVGDIVREETKSQNLPFPTASAPHLSKTKLRTPKSGMSAGLK